MSELRAVTSPYDVKALRSLVGKISSAIDLYEKVENNPAEAEIAVAQIAKSADELHLETEDPLKRLFVISHQAGQLAALRSAVGTGLFDKFPMREDATLQELAKSTGTDPALLVRLLRMLSAMSFVKETGIHRYTLTRHGKCLQVANYRSMIVMGFDCHFLADAKIPEFLESTGWKNPVDTSNTAFNLAYQKSIFEYIAATPGLMEHFHAAMAASGDFGLHNAVQEVPWPEILGPVEKDNVALVDLGGADGSLLMQILHKYPELTGEFILQDLPDVIEKGKDKLHKRVKSMPHDFFTEEPVKGARAYHLRMIFHDWPVEDCKRILRNLKPAMRPGYSKLLVTDAIIPDMGATLLHTTLDLAMMSISAEEKSESVFRDILASEGFIIKKVWNSVKGVDSVIEAELTA